MNSCRNHPKLFVHTLWYCEQLFWKSGITTFPFLGALLAQTQKIGVFSRNLGQTVFSQIGPNLTCPNDPYEGPSGSQDAIPGTQATREIMCIHILPFIDQKQRENDWKWAEKTYYWLYWANGQSDRKTDLTCQTGAECRCRKWSYFTF